VAFRSLSSSLAPALVKLILSNNYGHAARKSPARRVATATDARPQIIVIFCASGDLTQRKLVPALYKLRQERHIPQKPLSARREWSDDYFREQMREGIEQFSDGIGSEEMWQDSPRVSSIALVILTIQKSYQKPKDHERVRRETGNAGKQDVLPPVV